MDVSPPRHHHTTRAGATALRHHAPALHEREKGIDMTEKERQFHQLFYNCKSACECPFCGSIYCMYTCKAHESKEALKKEFEKEKR